MANFGADSPDFYILSHTYDTHVRYAPLYITRFALNAPRKQFGAQLFQKRWGNYGAIDNIPDRLRWLRHSRRLIQKDVAEIAGVAGACAQTRNSALQSKCPPNCAP